MKIEKIELHHISMDLVHPFQTSFGTKTARPCIVVAAYSEGLVGWGECVAGAGPFYSPESAVGAWPVMKKYAVPMVMGQEIEHPADVAKLLKLIRGNEMAKAGIENAVWDLFAKAEAKSLKEMIGGVRDRVAVGVSIGIQPSVEGLLARIGGFVEQGYGRIKIKIKKGLEYELMSAARREFPETMLMADANSDYELSDVDLLKRLDELDLLMLEQPLRYYDIIDHAKLQAQLETAVCLDESIHRPDDARYAIELNACRIINMKVGRVGGMSNAIQIHDMAQEAGIQMWCGGMLETGIGRATNIALASLPNFVLPGDISATDRYYEQDITRPFVLNKEDSTMTVPDGLGIGVEVDEARLAEVRLEHFVAEG